MLRGSRTCSTSSISALASAFLSAAGSICWLATGCEAAMPFELALGGVIAAVMLIYFVVALLRPEKF